MRCCRSTVKGILSNQRFNSKCAAHLWPSCARATVVVLSIHLAPSRDRVDAEDRVHSRRCRVPRGTHVEGDATRLGPFRTHGWPGNPGRATQAIRARMPHSRGSASRLRERDCRVASRCHQLGAARSRRGKTTSAHTIAIRMTDERTTMSKGATKPVRMALALR